MEQAQAQVVAQVPVAELVRLRVLVQAAVLELAQMQAQRLVQELELTLGLQLEWEPPLVRAQGREPARQQEPAAVSEPRQARKLRVSR